MIITVNHSFVIPALSFSLLLPLSCVSVIHNSRNERPFIIGITIIHLREIYLCKSEKHISSFIKNNWFCKEIALRIIGFVKKFPYHQDSAPYVTFSVDIVLAKPLFLPAAGLQFDSAMHGGDSLGCRGRKGQGPSRGTMHALTMQLKNAGAT